MPRSQGESSLVAEPKFISIKLFSKRRVATVLTYTIGAIGTAHLILGGSAERLSILFWWPLRVLWFHQPPFVGAITLWRDFGYFTNSPNPDVPILYAAIASTYAIEYIIIAACAYLVAGILKRLNEDFEGRVHTAVIATLMLIVAASILFYCALVFSSGVSHFIGLLS